MLTVELQVTDGPGGQGNHWPAWSKTVADFEPVLE